MKEDLTKLMTDEVISAIKESMNNLAYIDIMFGGICKGCRHADLQLRSVESFGEKFWAISCNHARACEAAREKALREVEGKSDDTNETKKKVENDEETKRSGIQMDFKESLIRAGVYSET